MILSSFMNCKYVFLFVPLIIFHSHAQTIIIDNNTKTPLVDVNIYNNLSGVTSNDNGQCFLDNVFKENDTITFSLIGYENLQIIKSDIPSIVQMTSQTIPLDIIDVISSSKGSKRRYRKLERDVRKVYPYAKVFSKHMIKYDSIMDTLQNYSSIRRYYKKRKIFSGIEDELLLKYDYSVRKLTKSQGRILIRLIDREANRTSYAIIKDFRNVFIAGFWQITARIFGHNLKSNFDPSKGEDRMIEYIINQIEKV